MFKLTEALGLEQGVISAWGKPLVTEACCLGGKGGKGRPAPTSRVQAGSQHMGKGFHYRNGQTSDSPMKATRGERLGPYVESLITEGKSWVPTNSII